LLVKKLEDKDSRVVLDAASQMTRLGSSIAPSLIEARSTRAGCSGSRLASGLPALEPRLVNATLLDIAKEVQGIL
jgi:hypothetical protein